jgi:hypothetical protein
MNSFNVYGQTTETIGGNTPVWLGTVKPIPVGAKIDVGATEHYVAGKAVYYNPETKEISIQGDSASAIESANAYLYNDVFASDGDYTNLVATCAVVMHHPEGLLIERVYPEITEEQIATLQAKIPGVLLVRG